MQANQLNAEVVRDTVSHLFDPLLSRPRSRVRSMISTQLEFNPPFLPLSSSSSPRQSLAVFRSPATVFNKIPSFHWTMDVIEATKTATEHASADWNARVTWRLRSTLAGFTVWEHLSEQNFQLHFAGHDSRVAPGVEGGEERVAGSGTFGDTLKHSVSPNDDLLLVRVDVQNRAVSISRGWVSRTVIGALQWLCMVLLPLAFEVLSMFKLAIPHKTLPSTHGAQSGRRRHHQRRQATSSVSNPSLRPMHLHQSLIDGSDVGSEYETMSTATAAEPGLSNTITLISLAFFAITGQVSDAIGTTKNAISATFDEVVALFYALRRCVVVFVQVILGVLGVGMSLAEAKVRDAIDEGERYGREEWERERRLEAELRHRTISRVSLTSAQKANVQSRARSLKKRVSFSCPDDESPFVTETLIGYPSPPSSTEGTLSMDHYIPANRFMPPSFFESSPASSSLLADPTSPFYVPTSSDSDDEIGGHLRAATSEDWYARIGGSGQISQATEGEDTRGRVTMARTETKPEHHDSLPDYQETEQQQSASLNPLELSSVEAKPGMSTLATIIDSAIAPTPSKNTQATEELDSPGTASPNEGFASSNMVVDEFDRANIGKFEQAIHSGDASDESDVVHIRSPRAGALPPTFPEIEGRHSSDTASLRALLDSYPHFSQRSQTSAPRSASDEGSTDSRRRERLMMGARIPLPPSPAPIITSTSAHPELYQFSPRSTLTRRNSDSPTRIHRRSPDGSLSSLSSCTSADANAPTLSPRASLFPNRDYGESSLSQPSFEVSPPETIQEEEDIILDIRHRSQSSHSAQSTEVIAPESERDEEEEESGLLFLTPSEGISPQSSLLVTRDDENIQPFGSFSSVETARPIDEANSSFTQSELGEGLGEEGPYSYSMNRGFSTQSGTSMDSRATSFDNESPVTTFSKFGSEFGAVCEEADEDFPPITDLDADKINAGAGMTDEGEWMRGLREKSSTASLSAPTLDADGDQMQKVTPKKGRQKRKNQKKGGGY